MSNDIRTRILRDNYGWKAASNLDLVGEANRLLQIRTYKNDRGFLVTRATVHKKIDGGGLQHIMGFGTPGGDYSETLVSTKPARVTEKVISAQHDSVLSHLPGILAAVEAHYVKTPAHPAMGQAL
jgi:hypothetical protein